MKIMKTMINLQLGKKKHHKKDVQMEINTSKQMYCLTEQKIFNLYLEKIIERKKDFHLISTPLLPLVMVLYQL